MMIWLAGRPSSACYDALAYALYTVLTARILETESHTVRDGHRTINVKRGDRVIGGMQ